MDANSPRPSAQIISFPAGGRRSALILSNEAKFAAEVRSLRKLKIVAETGWYHQEAVEQAAPNRKN
ncbi:MAG: DUF2735 domain-containing protein [Hyphomicrobiales bacterium]|nr:DUF2735 domain-containing protein [Hyphomicrobiales bacterium]